MAKKRRKKSKRTKLKEKTWNWCSKYTRLRDAIELTKQLPTANNICARCVTCGTIKHIKKGDAGHFIGRGSGGSSGVYFDERNIHFQCKRCNGFESQNKQPVYERYMLAKYDQSTIDELRIKHKTKTYSLEEIQGLGIYYKQEYQRLCEEIGFDPWNVL